MIENRAYGLESGFLTTQSFFVVWRWLRAFTAALGRLQRWLCLSMLAVLAGWGKSTNMLPPGQGHCRGFHWSGHSGPESVQYLREVRARGMRVLGAAWYTLFSVTRLSVCPL